ncbi:MAG TPA: MgtC/SapB family protein [Candidatus Dormibacteraeota bacterium]|nr:MgtC/SapB family protein [Candidatus Dormibacteraeota bacterium]
MTVQISMQFDLALRLLLAVLLGAAIGVEREFSRHPAGLRTLILVSMGSCLFTSLGVALASNVTDPTRIAAQVVTGIGFLGAGAILHQGNIVKGLTTAASTWVAAAVGMTCGFGLFVLAILATVVTVISLIAIGKVEDRFMHKHDADRDNAHD